MPKYHVQRSIEINASPEKVFDVVADFGTWTTWSPWLCAEPEAKVTVSDDSASIGSLYQWEGELVGQGEMEHQQLDRGKRIVSEIRFIKPFKSISEVTFDFEPAGEGTKLTWHMDGSLPWFLFWMVSKMDIFIGMDYDRGLKMLKEWIETGSVLTKTTIQGIQAIGPLHVLGTRAQCTMKTIGPSMEQSMARAIEILTQNNMCPESEAISVYHEFDMKAQSFDYTIGYLFPSEPTTVPDGLSYWSIPEVQALRVDHHGSYENLGNGWSAAMQYVRYKKLRQSKAGTFELYKNDPKDTAPADLLTEIYLPLK